MNFSRPLRSLRGRGFGGMPNPFDMFGTRGYHRELLNNHSRNSLHGYDCDTCMITYDGQHICKCRVALQTQLALIQEIEDLGMIYDSCGCPDCPFEPYGYGGGAHPLLVILFSICHKIRLERNLIVQQGCES